MIRCQKVGSEGYSASQAKGWLPPVEVSEILIQQADTAQADTSF